MTIPVSLLQSHLDYTAWATNLILEAVSAVYDDDLTRDMGVSHTSILATLQHIYYADRVWLARLEGRTINFADEGDGPGYTELTSVWPAVLKDFRDYAERLAEDEANETFTYKNLKGEDISLVRGQAILHVVNHATLHRGQIVALLRQLGKTPPATDLLFFYRR
jgi:uncharacterized damage-inducible protein DinB